MLAEESSANMSVIGHMQCPEFTNSLQFRRRGPFSVILLLKLTDTPSAYGVEIVNCPRSE